MIDQSEPLLDHENDVNHQATNSIATTKTEDLFFGGVPQIQNGEREADQKVIEAWLSMKGSNSTRVNYRRHIERLFENFPGRTIRSMTSHHIAHHFKNLETDFGLKKSSIRASRETLSSLYSYCVKSGYIELKFNPMNAVGKIEVPDQVGFRVLGRFQVDRMIEVEKNPRNKLLILFLLVTGMRVSEAVGLTKRNFKNHDGILRISIIGKGQKYRAIICPEWLWAEIEAYVSSEQYPFSEWSDVLPLFPSQVEPYSALTNYGAWHIVKQAAKRAKLTDSPSPHWLRHCHALFSLKEGASLHVLKQTLGHSSLDTTGKYLRAFPTEASSNFIKRKD